VLLNLLNFELDVWGRLRQQTKAARAELRASEEDRKPVMTSVVGDVETGYFSLSNSTANSIVTGARSQLAKLAQAHHPASARRLGHLLYVRQAEEWVYQASEMIPDTERAIEQTENQISFLLGNNPGSIPRGQSLTQQEVLPAVPPGLPSSLLERRPEYSRCRE
jgi:multidrug efflux system outer membrane protein